MENSGVCTTYVSKGHSDGDGDGTEEHDDTQREQDALTGCDIDLQQEGALIWLFFSLWSFTTEFFLSFFYFALEAEDGDRETDHGCDSHTQQYWFSVVKAAARTDTQHIHIRN